MGGWLEVLAALMALFFFSLLRGRGGGKRRRKEEEVNKCDDKSKSAKDTFEGKPIPSQNPQVQKQNAPFSSKASPLPLILGVSGQNLCCICVASHDTFVKHNVSRLGHFIDLLVIGFAVLATCAFRLAVCVHGVRLRGVDEFISHFGIDSFNALVNSSPYAWGREEGERGVREGRRRKRGWST